MSELALYENETMAPAMCESTVETPAITEKEIATPALCENVARSQIQEENIYITFMVGNELFGIDVSCVDTIIQMPAITRVPAAPSYFTGIINLRGEIIPIMSLGRRFNSSEDTITSKSSVIILDMGDNKLMGVTIDDVREVVTFKENEIEEPSPFLKKEITFIRGVAKKDDDLISILDVATLV